jgi:hypothetical protein
LFTSGNLHRHQVSSSQGNGQGWWHRQSENVAVAPVMIYGFTEVSGE